MLIKQLKNKIYLTKLESYDGVNKVESFITTRLTIYQDWLKSEIDNRISQEYLSSPAAITEGDLDIYAEKYSSPSAMRDGFEYYRAFLLDAVQDKALVNQSKLQVPVLGSRLLSSIRGSCTRHSCSQCGKGTGSKSYWH